jgi:hypothetical protein
LSLDDGKLYKLNFGNFMKNIAILCSSGDDMPKKGEQSHVFLDNAEINVEQRKQRRK